MLRKIAFFFVLLLPGMLQATVHTLGSGADDTNTETWTFFDGADWAEATKVSNTYYQNSDLSGPWFKTERISYHHPSGHAADSEVYNEASGGGSFNYQKVMAQCSNIPEAAKDIAHFLGLKDARGNYVHMVDGHLQVACTDGSAYDIWKDEAGNWQINKALADGTNQTFAAHTDGGRAAFESLSTATGANYDEWGYLPDSQIQKNLDDMTTMASIPNATGENMHAAGNGAGASLDNITKDMDGDGTPDYQDKDKDGDGFSNIEELKAGTNPSDTKDNATNNKAGGTNYKPSSTGNVDLDAARDRLYQALQPLGFGTLISSGTSTYPRWHITIMGQTCDVDFNPSTLLGSSVAILRLVAVWVINLSFLAMLWQTLKMW